MVVKDKVIGWFIRNVIMPGMEIIDKPGFIVCKVTEKKETTYLRELFLPESLFIELEKNIVKKYGNRGRQALYSIGKKFGYLYSDLSKFPSIKKDSEEIKSFIYYFVRYLEASYAKKIDYNINLDKKTITLILDNYIVCRKNGLGYIMSDGGSAGIWSYIMSDNTVEGVQIKCQGRGNKKCELICAPSKILSKKKYKYLRETNLKISKIDKSYENINQIRKAVYSKNSLKDLIDSGFFNHSAGSINRKNERHFLCEATLSYLIESEIKKLGGGVNLLFDTSFNFGKKMASQEKGSDYHEFVNNYMSALGWGDILVTEKNKKIIVISNYYPWIKSEEKIDFTLFRGLISGLLTGFIGREILLKKINSDTSQGFLIVTASE